MQAASRDARLILFGICLAWTVGDLLAHRWEHIVMDVVLTVVMAGTAWPIRLFASQAERQAS